MSSQAGELRRSPLAVIRGAIPRGNTLPDDMWRRRHKWLLWVLAAHAIALPIYAMLSGYPLTHSALHVAPLLGALAIGRWSTHKRLASTAVVIGLLTCSALAVHTSGGLIEAHFHFFVMIILLALYEDWMPFLLAIAFVVLHHGATTAFDANGVYDHSDAVENPWKWAAIHGAFVLVASAGLVASWRLNEDVRTTARASEERFRRSFEDAPYGMALGDLEGRFIQVNHSLCAMLGRTEESLVGKTFAELTHPADRASSVADLAAMLAGDRRSVKREKRYLHLDGRAVWVALSVSSVLDEHGNLQYFIGQMEDIADRRRAEAAAVRRSAQQAELTELGSLVLGGMDLESLFAESVDRTAARLGSPFVSLLELRPGGEAFDQIAAVGWPANREVPADRDRSLAGIALSRGETVYIGDLDAEDTLGAETLADLGFSSGVAAVVADRGGEPFGVLTVLDPRPDAFSADDVHFVQAVATIVGGAVQQRRSEEALRHQSLHDPLTGLPNRALFLDRLTHALARAQRTGETLAVLFCDLDEFKVINDSLGHQAGDQLLQGLAPRLADELRANDTLARFGGDEFVVLCEELNDSAEALLIAERLRDVFAKPSKIGEQEHYISSSIGVAVSSPAYSGRPDALIRDADAAMYRAKGGGRDRVELFDEDMRAKILGRLEVEQGLRRALRESELVLHYQPLVSLEDERVFRCEALLRWQHPVRGLVPPMDFIPIAEESGLIVPIGEWVLNEACRQAAEWTATATHPDLAAMQMSVNLSAVQVAQPDLPAVVARALKASGLAPDRLTLEITETALIEDPDGAAQVLEALNALGVHVSLDDFGTGYSSLSSIKRYPLSAIKLDRSFIAGLAPGTEDAAIISSVVAMAHALSLSTVAEGVETEAQAAHLREMGCDIGQGYLFCRPVAPDEFEQRFTAALPHPA